MERKSASGHIQDQKQFIQLIRWRLRAIRKKSGFTQAQISEYLGVDRTTYATWETGRRCPNIYYLKLIVVDLFGYSLDDFLDENISIEEILMK